MKRRDFLGLVGAGSALTLLPTRLFATETERRPLWIQVSAGGGWDPSALCDPYPQTYSTSFGVGETIETEAGHRIRYADLGGAAGDFYGNQGYEFAEFFEKHAEKLLVMNGVYTASASHLSGASLAASGRLQAGYPTLAALVAAAEKEGRPMAFLAGSGGYVQTGGAVPATRLSDVRYLDELAHLNGYGNSHEAIYSEDEYAALVAAREARMNRLIARESRPSVQKSLEMFSRSRSGHIQLTDFKAAYDAGPLVSLPEKNNYNAVMHSVFDQGFKAIIGYSEGMTAAATLNVGVFDTHDEHDNSHLVSLQGLIQALDLLVQEAEARGVPTVFLVNSEFGRTASYNVSAGKDHWPVTSWLMLQTTGLEVFSAGRVVGASTYDAAAHQVLPQALSPDSLEVLEEGEWLYPGGIHVALRQLAQVEDTPWADHEFPLKDTDWSVIFG